MRHYETVFISNPDLPDEETAQVIETYRQVLIDGGAEILKTDDWGRRRMAYEIKKFTKGYYVLFEYVADDPACIAELERRMRLDDRVIRFMTVKKADSFDRAEYEARQAKAEAPPAEKEKPAEEATEAEEAPADKEAGAEETEASEAEAETEDEDAAKGE